MIIKEPHNIAVSAPHIEDMAGALALFRVYKGDDMWQMSHLVTFLSTESHERTEFLSQFSEETVILNNRYAKRTLTILA